MADDKDSNGYYMNSGFFYCPYIPLDRKPIDVSGFNPSKGILTRYGKKLLEQGDGYYGKVNMNESNKRQVEEVNEDSDGKDTIESWDFQEEIKRHASVDGKSLTDIDPEELFKYEDYYPFPVVEDGKIKEYVLEKYEDMKHLVQDEDWEPFYSDCPYELTEQEQEEHDVIKALNEKKSQEKLRGRLKDNDLSKNILKAILEQLNDTDEYFLHRGSKNKNKK